MLMENRATMRDVRDHADMVNTLLDDLGVARRLEVRTAYGRTRICWQNNGSDIWGGHGTKTELYKKLDLLYDVLYEVLRVHEGK